MSYEVTAGAFQGPLDLLLQLVTARRVDITEVSLGEAADELARRLIRLFLPGPDGRPCHGGDPRYREDPNFRDLILFYEYFHADTGRGCGASHQTGWTALVVRLIRERRDKLLRS